MLGFFACLFLISDNHFQGTVYPSGNHSGPSYVAAPFVIPDQSDSMLYLAFSEYFFQTSSFAYYTAGAFNITIAEEVSRVQKNGVRGARHHARQGFDLPVISTWHKKQISVKLLTVKS